jgi:hypothetical protein
MTLKSFKKLNPVEGEELLNAICPAKYELPGRHPAVLAPEAVVVE